VKIHFHHPAFDTQLLRAISYTYFESADIGECLATAARVKEGDFESWHEQWRATADHVFEIAAASEKAKQPASAREAYLRAANYYRTALFFEYQSPLSENLLETFRKHGDAFSRAAKLMAPPAEPVEIPYEGEQLPGYFYRAKKSKRPRATIIVNGGYDSTHQEAYFSFVPAALRRDYHVLAFDGPGQGEMLFNRQLPMRHDWEKVVGPVVDYLLERDDVDPEGIVLLGQSWGGFLAARAAAFEPRLAALITNPGHFDVMQNIRRITNGEIEGEIAPPDFEAFFQAAMSEKYFTAKIRAKMLVHGVETPGELFEEWQKYTLAHIAQNIRCPTFVTDAQNDTLSPGQGRQLYEALSCPKKYVLFSTSEGAGEHCAAGALSLFTQRTFDWLDATLKNPLLSALN